MYKKFIDKIDKNYIALIDVFFSLSSCLSLRCLLEKPPLRLYLFLALSLPRARVVLIS